MPATIISDVGEKSELKLLLEYGTAIPDSQIFNRESWDQHVATELDAKSPIITLTEFNAMTHQQQAESQFLRRKYTLKLAPIFSSRYNAAFEELLRVANTNIDLSNGIRFGTVLTGPPTVGKSTILIWAGRRYERRRRAIHRAQFGSDQYARGMKPYKFTPVIYVSLDGTRTLKALLQNIAAFLEVPKYDALDELKLKAAIAEFANKCGTSLIMIDDLHFLDKRFVGPGPLTNDIKKWMSTIPATFFYAGIDCERIGLFREWHEKSKVEASQTDHRFGKIELHPFQHANNVDLQEIADVLKTFDDRCVLLKHEPGDLQRLLPYIMDRTSGYMGAVSTLIKHGAAYAIANKEERYSIELFDKIRLDNAAEKSRRKRETESKLPNRKTTSPSKPKNRKPSKPAMEGESPAK